MKLSDTIVPIISATGLIPGFENKNWTGSNFNEIIKDLENAATTTDKFNQNGFKLNDDSSSTGRRTKWNDIILTEEQTRIFESIDTQDISAGKGTTEY